MSMPLGAVLACVSPRKASRLARALFSMLIVSNGAFKSGSTWLDRLVRHIVRPTQIPDRFQNPNWVNQSVAPNLVEQFLSGVDATEIDYVSKNHVRDGQVRQLLLSYEHVRVVNITRDLRDVLVSAYYHDRREGRANGGIAAYWQGLGKRRIQGSLNITGSGTRVTLRSLLRRMKPCRRRSRPRSRPWRPSWG